MRNIDINDFLQPIPSNESEKNIGECGKYLKYDYVYDQIKELRREDDPRLSQGVWLIEPKKAAWNDVEKVCEFTLKNKTKDLQIAVWWLEAETAMYGFSGLNQGIMLLHALCEKYWDNIWPAIDSNGDITARMAPFYFFAEKISDKILMIPLTYPQDGISEVFSLSDWVTARHNLRVKNSSGITLKDFQKSIATTPIDFLAEIDNGVNNVMENLKKLEGFLNEHCEKDAPSFRVICEHVNDIKQVNTKNLVERKKQVDEEVSKRKAQLAAELAAENNADEEETIQEEVNDNNATPTIEQAYNALDEIAAFLEKEQPQSPSSALIKIASAIGKKTFRELLEVNTQNGATLMGTISELYRILKKDSKDISNQETQQKENA